MARALKFFVLGLVLLAAGIGLLRLNFWIGLGTFLVGIAILGWFQGEFLRQLILWSQRKSKKSQMKSEPVTQTTSQVTSAASPYVIQNPKIGFLNLAGEEGRVLAERDLVEVGAGFSAVSEIESTNVPKCNVLFLYCALNSSGGILKQSYSLRDIIRAAGAHVAVVASNIPQAIVTSSEFNRFLQSKDEWPANIVITLNRNGEAFGCFFKSLFSQMRAGITMPHAWVKLAPQGPASALDNPGTVVLLEAGHVVFSAS